MKNKILDFSDRSKRYYGHDFSLQKKIDKVGYKWKIACWYPKRPIKGDIILMGLSKNDCRSAIIEEVFSCGNPSDMYFLNINIKDSQKSLEKLKEE